MLKTPSTFTRCLMRIARASCFILLLLMSAITIAARSNQKTQLPKKGDTIVVKGCLRGSSVEGAQTMTVGETGEAVEESGNEVPSLTYRLQGDKSLLRELKEKHDRQVVEVKGILRSELSRGALGANVGRTRISVGVDPRMGSVPPGTDQALPVLEAKSFEASTVSCGK
jgi:hypothetical protein